ncbi:MAG: chloride channel protein [Bacteroidales bacterium]|nr:chloride channel protein [Bacteroidales bacterium]
MKPQRTFLYWIQRIRRKYLNDRQYMMMLSVVIGFLSGLAAVIIKNAVHLIQRLLTSGFDTEYDNILYIFYPVIGIVITVFFIKFILRQYVGDGVPSVLYAISKTKGVLKKHNMFSSVISSSITVGFGGSVGLEGPTVATGAAIGSNLAKALHLSYKQTVTLLAVASAAAMSAIFKSPIAAIVFAMEVIMLDLTVASLVPLLLASVTAALTSYFFLGMNVLYPFDIEQLFRMKDIWLYVILGVFAGLISLYFTRVFIFFQNTFSGINKWYWRLGLGGILLGFLIFLFPSLFGEGYAATNACLHGKTNTLFDNGLFYGFKDNLTAVFILMIVVMLLKVVATSLTFGAGGIGGIFAPTLFTGAHAGLFFALVYNQFGFDHISETNFALVGMAGLIAGVIHAPLTAVFLIAEITDGYGLFMPLMITSVISYMTIRIFTANSIYTIQLAKRGELMTHHQDKNVLSMIDISKLIETNFKIISYEATLRDLVNVIEGSQRNIFPVLDCDGQFRGHVILDNVRQVMFKPEIYDTTYVKDLMNVPVYRISPTDTVEEVAQKFQASGKYNMPLLNQGKYLGYISKANLFGQYRSKLKEVSDY